MSAEVARYWTKRGPRHSVVDVTVHVNVHRIGATGHEITAEKDDQHQKPAGTACDEHRRNGGHQEQRDDSRLGEHDEVLKERSFPRQRCGRCGHAAARIVAGSLTARPPWEAMIARTTIASHTSVPIA